MKKPTIAITMGDPAGIGPEIVARALGEAEVRACCNPVVIGDPKILARALELIGSRLSIVIVSTPAGAGTDSSTLDIVLAGEVPRWGVDAGNVGCPLGRISSRLLPPCGRMAKAGDVSAIVSTPFNKEAFHMAGIMAMDDIAYFHQCFGGPDHAYMVGEVAGLWVTTVTFHVPFRAIADLITVEALLEKIRGLHRVCEQPR
jgi:4-hydroxy-L-threonine phosphate dehydrogenase PdxA